MILTYLLKVSVCLGLFYGLYYFLFRRFTFHRLNRIYLLLTLVLSFMIPFIEPEQKRIVEITSTVTEPLSLSQKMNFEDRGLASVNAPTETLDESISTVPETESWIAALTWAQWSMGIYGIGLLGMLIFFIRRLLQIAFMYRKYQNDSKKEWIEVSDSFTAASFFGIVFLNSQTLTEIETKQVLLHEQTHARLLHSADILFVEVCKVILWFNPVVYFCKKSLAEVHEYEVDERLTAQLGAKTYAHLILKLATQSSDSLLHPFSKHPVTHRIQFIFQKPTIAMKKTLYVLVLLLGIAGVWAFAPRKEVIVYKETPKAAKKVEEMPAKVYPLRFHTRHVWRYFEQQKKQTPKNFSGYNLTLNDLCIMPNGIVYYLVNPNSFNLEDLATVNQRIAKPWKIEIVITEKSLDAEGKLSKIGLAVKNLRTNQVSSPEVIDMVKARELGKQGAYLDLQIKSPTRKAHTALCYGDETLFVTQSSTTSKDHLIDLFIGESSTLKLSQDQIEYFVYPDKVNLETLRKVSEYFKEAGFNLITADEKYGANHQLSSLKVGLHNNDNGAFYPLVLNDLRHYENFAKQNQRHRFDELLTLRANKITGKVEIEIGSDWTDAMKKKGHLMNFTSERNKIDSQKTAQNEVISDENWKEFNKVVKDMYSKETFFKRIQMKLKIDGVKDMLIFAQGGEGTTVISLAVAVGKSPVYYLDGIKVKEEAVKSLRPSHIKKVDILEPEYNRYSAFVKEHKLDVKNVKLVWMERKGFDFKKLPASNINKRLSLNSASADTIRTFLPANDLGKNPLVFINGEEMPASILTRVDPSKFGMSYIAKPNDFNAISKYGVRALDGVVDIKSPKDCFFKTENERFIAIENIKKTLNTSQERFSKITLRKADGGEFERIVIRSFVHNGPFVTDFPKNAKIIYMMDGKPVNEGQIKNYKGKFQSAMRWKKTGGFSKMQQKYGDLIADYDGGIDIKTTR